MRVNRLSGSEGGGTEPNRFSLPLSRHWMAGASPKMSNSSQPVETEC
jgi:hypothetical protein